MNTHDELILTPAMTSTRQEEIADIVERAELDLARFRHEGQELAARRAAHQRQARRTDAAAFTVIAVVIIAAWGGVFALGGWRTVAAVASCFLIGGAVLIMARSFRRHGRRAANVLSGRL
jgi:undecaprenyl pyrophosphate phosphatase UppP